MATTAAATSGLEYNYVDTADLTSGAKRRVCEDIIYSQDPIDLPLRDYFGGYESLTVKSNVIEYLEDNHMAIAGAIGATGSSGTAGGSTWNLTTTAASLPVADGDVFMVGDVLLSANGEVMVVSDVNESGNTIDVYERGEGTSTESVANTDGDALYIIGNAHIEGFTYGNDPRFMTRASKKNYTQIFEETLSVSKSYEEVAAKGSLIGIKSEVKHQLKMKQLRQAKLLERAVIYGVYDSGGAEGTSAAPRLMCGIISAGTGTIDIQTNTLDLNSAEITEANLNSEMQSIFDAGGKPDTIICNSFNKGVISSWMTPYRRTDMEDNKYGGVVDTYKNDFGVCSIILDRYMLPADVIILAKKNFKIGALRPFKIVDLPNDRDSFRQSIVGEYTCMLYNEEHASHIYECSTS